MLLMIIFPNLKTGVIILVQLPSSNAVKSIKMISQKHLSKLVRSGLLIILNCKVGTEQLVSPYVTGPMDICQCYFPSAPFLEDNAPLSVCVVSLRVPGTQDRAMTVLCWDWHC